MMAAQHPSRQWLSEVWSVLEDRDLTEDILESPLVAHFGQIQFQTVRMDLDDRHESRSLRPH